ncbi:hypothetical protein SK128_009717 [Halocaridina rubra]|uniref:Glutamyl-tRNA(Gln) amidotransferase subunit C, mitochondrial n=1 Tax=Halocaridina rubra TaxID=373956 RepID=A0AAN8XSR9_HALRR
MLTLKQRWLSGLWKKYQSLPLRCLISTSISKGKQSKVPQYPVDPLITDEICESDTKIDIELVQHLEKLSLVDFANKEGLLRLQAAISLADQLRAVNTEGVEPMYSVLEDRSITLAEDEVLIGNISDDILGCAKETLEDYFVVPPGNIDYIPEDSYYEKLKDDKT